MKHHLKYLALAAFIALFAAPLGAQVATKSSVTLELAKKVAAKAAAEAAKNKWTMVIAIVDEGGNLVYLEKMDGTQTASVKVAEGKARSAAQFKRPTKVFEDIVAGGGAGLRILGLEGAVPIEGGLPIIIGGKFVGAIGASGGSATQDGQTAKAGVAAVN
jgi:glc operon protein GlcG